MTEQENQNRFTTNPYNTLNDMDDKERKREERKKKLEQSLSDVRKKAIAVETALQNRSKAEELQKKQLQRKFASPTNADEAEGELPTMQVLLGGRSERDIIDNGTLLEKIRLYFIYRDFDGYFGASKNLKEEVMANLAVSVKTKEDDELGAQCGREFVAFTKYGERLSYYFQIYQTSFAILARLLNLWDNYEKQAERITLVFSRWLERDPEVAEWMVKINLDHSLLVDKWEGAILRFDKEKKVFYVDVDTAPSKGEQSLYSQIQKEAASTAEALSDFKAFAIVAQDYIAKSKLHYMPISIQMSIENAEEEKYTRYLVKNLSFFRSELNFSKSKGKNITPDEERRAVIPDYYEVEPTQAIYDNCKMGMEQFLNN